MSNLAIVRDIDPRYENVEFNGKTYVTSHLVHRAYKAEGGEKFTDLGNLNKCIRSIPSYQELVELGQIVELNQRDSIMESLIKSNSYKPVMLVGAVARSIIDTHLETQDSKFRAIRAAALDAAVVTGDASAKQIAGEALTYTSQLNQNIDIIQNAAIMIQDLMDVVTKSKQETLEALEAKRLADCGKGGVTKNRNFWKRIALTGWNARGMEFDQAIADDGFIDAHCLFELITGKNPVTNYIWTVVRFYQSALFGYKCINGISNFKARLISDYWNSLQDEDEDEEE